LEVRDLLTTAAAATRRSPNFAQPGWPNIARRQRGSVGAT